MKTEQFHALICPPNGLTEPLPVQRGLVSTTELMNAEKDALYDRIGRVIAIAVDNAHQDSLIHPITNANLQKSEIFRDYEDVSAYHPLSDFSKLSLLVKERVDLQIDSVVDGLRNAREHELYRFYEVLQNMTYRYDFSPKIFIGRGTGTATDVIQGLIGVIPKIMLQDANNDPDVAFRIAQNSYPLAIQLGKVHLETLRDARNHLRIAGDGRYFSPFDPKRFRITHLESQPRLEFTDETVDYIASLQQKPRNIASNPGCPAIRFGSIKKMWEMHMPVLKEIYLSQMTPSSSRTPITT